MTDNITRREVEELIDKKNVDFERYIKLQMDTINDKLDTIADGFKTIDGRQNAFDMALLKTELKWENRGDSCPLKTDVETLKTDLITRSKLIKIITVTITLTTGLTTAIFTALKYIL